MQFTSLLISGILVMSSLLVLNHIGVGFVISRSREKSNLNTVALGSVEIFLVPLRLLYFLGRSRSSLTTV